MLTSINRRLRTEDGLSMVEMLMAMVVIVVALFALLGSLVAAASSVVDQQARSGATRALTTHMENVRTMGFSELQEAIDDGGLEDQPIEINGQTFTLETDLDEVDAADPDSAPVPGQPSMIRVTATVHWNVRGDPRSITSSTAVASDDPQLVQQQSINSVNFDPNPTLVDADGMATGPTNVKLVLSGFDDTALVMVTWDDDAGIENAKTLQSFDNGVTWTGQVEIQQFVEESEVVYVPFTLKAGAINKHHDQPVRREGDGSVVFTLISISQNPITVHAPKPNCNGANKCTNTQNVVFTAEVTGLDPALGDTVSMKYELVNGASAEVKLDHIAGDTWSYTAQAGSTKFKPGNPQPFTFSALLGSGATGDSTVFMRWVEAVST